MYSAETITLNVTKYLIRMPVNNVLAMPAGVYIVDLQAASV